MFIHDRGSESEIRSLRWPPRGLWGFQVSLRTHTSTFLHAPWTSFRKHTNKHYFGFLVTYKPKCSVREQHYGYQIETEPAATLHCFCLSRRKIIFLVTSVWKQGWPSSVSRVYHDVMTDTHTHAVCSTGEAAFGFWTPSPMHCMFPTTYVKIRS